jgi:hypothetical protein
MYWVKNEDGTYEVMDGQQRSVIGNNLKEVNLIQDLENSEKEM